MNEFETAVVNESSVFEPLKFYCKRCVQIKGVMFMVGKNSTSWIGTQNTKFQLKTSNVFQMLLKFSGPPVFIPVLP